MSHKHSFTLRSEDARRDLPGKVILAQQLTETTAHVLLKLLGFVLFHRERLQIETNLHDHSIPFVPDLVQLDYQLRPVLWVECGECSVTKLDKLAVKVPEAELWILKRSLPAAEDLLRAMRKADLRRDRYRLIGFDAPTFDELCAMVSGRNELICYHARFDPPAMQLDFNGLWFDLPFTILNH